ncbi:hypothetical protein A2671_01135 [Candidatus Kaiserbacteria bacterium RIFCSPHIGHO2_01_FULL_49_13]|uniref:Uncharacterized protein n=1 Tax=Candidatus Kaiserbacteria bacterium RIFCSPHIGHO2_01_FULL_49_13 TaxID=1798477 RepID=A0A1F6CDB0_9BACT|nr:MAG: hypothetical protein A2671_01135 [Candidatus Kaiserbacteria bacterium RIFCSPHIGHO2_01_FULL_49_13]
MFRTIREGLQGILTPPTLICALLLFLLPLFFIPGLSVTVSFAKMLLFGVAILAMLGVLLVRELREGVINLPLNILTVAALLVPVAYIIASFASPAPLLSLFGQGFELDTAFTMLLVFLSLILTASVTRTKGSAVYALLALLCAFGVLVLFHLARLFFGPETFSFGIFLSRTATLMGKWNDFAIFSGLIALFAAVSLTELTLRRGVSYLMWAIFLLALIFTAITNLALAWVVLGAFASLYAAYLLFARKKESGEMGLDPVLEPIPKRSKMPYAVMVLLVVSVLFVFDSYTPALFNQDNTFFNRYLAGKLNLAQLEARPSWGTTFDIGKEAFSSDALTGIGPNTFAEEWLLRKPETINQTIFWNTVFSSGIGLVPTSFVTTGVLGIIAWILFFAAFLIMGYRALRVPRGDPLTDYLRLLTFALSAYLWVFTIFYVPSLTLLVYAAIMTGLFVALLYQSNILPSRMLSLNERPRIGFAVSLVLIVLLIASVVGVYSVGRKFAGAMYFDRSLTALNNGDLESADSTIARAITFSDTDRYRQLAAQVQIARVGALIADNQNPTAAERDTLLNLVQTAIGHAVAATNYDENNFYNWMSLGQVYESLARLNVQGAYENATAAYDRAQTLNPTSPAVPLARARLEATRGEYEKARIFIGDAVKQKQDYTAAILLLSQIEIASGDTNRAIDALIQAAISSPNNPLIFFQLGFLEYSIKNNAEAIAALLRAVALDENYSNARYFLGLAHYRVGQTEEAIAHFEKIKELNPESVEVITILANLKAGKSPITGKLPPEKRSEPPFDE